MNINELVNRKLQMEQEIQAAISEAIKRFNADTELFPSSVSVNLVTESIFCAEKSVIVESVNCNIRL